LEFTTNNVSAIAGRTMSAIDRGHPNDPRTADLSWSRMHVTTPSTRPSNVHANRADAAGKQSVEKPTSHNSEKTPEQPTTRRPLRFSVLLAGRLALEKG
jgi:hypothetical protein